jgi:hypothetical protein
VHEQSGTSGARRAEAARQKAVAHAQEADKWQRLADAYEKGDKGERHTAHLLDILDGAGWVVLNDRYKAAGSPANIDHILVGPPGICVIDTKNWAGRIAVDARGLSANGWRRDAALQQAHELAGIVGVVGRQTVPSVITAPVLCFVGDVGLPAPVYEHGVVVLQADQLLGWLTSLTHNLQPPEVARLGSALSAHFWPRTESRTRLAVPGVAARSGPWKNPAPPGRTPARPSGKAVRPATARTRGSAAGLLSDLRSLAIRLTLLVLMFLLCLTLLPKVLTAVLTSALPHPSPTSTQRPGPRPTLHP